MVKVSLPTGNILVLIDEGHFGNVIGYSAGTRRERVSYFAIDFRVVARCAQAERKSSRTGNSKEMSNASVCEELAMREFHRVRRYLLSSMRAGIAGRQYRMQLDFLVLAYAKR